ncbi:MAG: hypothetical protein AABX93_00460 [Nanoarchaeota archaeon]
MILKGVNEFFSSKTKAKKGQLTIFVIAAIFVVAAAFLFFTFSGNFQASIPANLEPVYTTFISCLEEDTLSGIDILESQGGYIDVPDFEPGSAYMPFSSQLDFFGNPIPYWYYVSGNNIQKEQIPTKSQMEEQLQSYLEEKIRNCRFDNYYDDDFYIFLENPKANVNILDERVDVSLDADLTINKGDENFLAKNHKISINSQVGALFESANKIYDYEQSSLFLENYGVDVLRLYAPVDGVELTCSPKIWNGNDVYNELKNSIEANTQAIKIKGGDFSLTNSDDKYFISDISVPHNVRFLNSKNWSGSFEVNPAEESLLLATPVGTQPGLGILGFCYVPYHFVYSLKYPVLVQISGKSETFQFPLAIVIEGNKPRVADNSTAVAVNVPELCAQKNTQIEVNVLDIKFNKIDADVSYECSGTVCPIGRTSDGNVKELFPQCVNGYVIAKAQGYETAKSLYSVVQQGSTDIFLDKLHTQNVQLKLDGKDYNGQATISFLLDDGSSKVVVYPEQKTVDLSDGQYEIQVHIFKNSTINIAATKTEKCIEIPESGIGGFFGASKEKCFNIEFPAQIVSNALAGGGKQNHYLLDSDLENSKTIEISAISLPTPTTIAKLQDNYLLFEDRGLNVIFK